LATDSYFETTDGPKSSKATSQADLNEVVVHVNGEEEKKSDLNVFSVEQFPNSHSPALLTPSDSDIKANDDSRLSNMRDIELNPVDQLEKVHNGIVTPQSETKI
jgi:hypothetical protein